MPKSVKPITFESEGYGYELTSTRLQERDDPQYHYVRLKDIAKAWSNPAALEDGAGLGEASNYFYFTRQKNGSFDIGCRHFTPAKAALILKAAGVRVASAKRKAKSKKKAKSKSSKR